MCRISNDGLSRFSLLAFSCLLRRMSPLPCIAQLHCLSLPVCYLFSRRNSNPPVFLCCLIGPQFCLFSVPHIQSTSCIGTHLYCCNLQQMIMSPGTTIKSYCIVCKTFLWSGIIRLHLQNRFWNPLQFKRIIELDWINKQMYFNQHLPFIPQLSHLRTLFLRLSGVD